jgi:hypothetical protein
VIGVLLAIALVAHLAAHVALTAALAKRISAARTALAFFVSPIAPYFGFKNGLPRRAWVWIGTLGLYAAAVGLVRGCV